MKDYFTRKMFLRQFVPALISAVGLAVGDVADAVVVGRSMGVTGLAAVGLALPVFMIINVLMHGFGIGGSIRFSAQLARGEKEAALCGFQGMLTVALIVGGLLCLVGNLCLPQVLSALGAATADSTLYVTSRTYIHIILSGAPLFFISYILNYYLRNDDNEKLAGFGFTVGNLIDIALNVIFVLIMGIGVAGAAWATLIGQAISICVYLFGLRGKNRVLRVFPLRPNFKGTFGCVLAGMASSVKYFFSMLFVLFANHVLLRLSGSAGIAVFNVVQNASFLILYLYEAAAKAAQPLVSTYFGEHNDVGRRETLRLGLCWGTVAGAAAIIVVALFPGAVCKLFGLDSATALELGIYALRVFCVGAGFAGISILLESHYQACREEKSAFILVTLRGVVVLLPATVLLSLLGSAMFWWVFPVTEIVSLLLFFLWHKRYRPKDGHIASERVLTRTIQGKNDELGVLTAEASDFCRRWGASPKQNYFVTMAIEELCLAIIQKGFCGQKGYLQVTLIAQEDTGFALHIRDSAVSFNPFSLQTEKVGESHDCNVDAIGVLVIREKAKEFFYRRYQGFNTLIVKI